MRQKSKRSQSIIERDDDGTFLREPRTVVAFLAPETGEETAAVDPDKNGKRDAGSGTRHRLRPDVEIETVFGNSRREWIDVGVRLVLYAVVAELACRADAAPALRTLRRFPAQLTDRRCGIRNSAKHRHAARGIDDAFERASLDRDARRLEVIGGEEASQSRRTQQDESER